MPPQFVFDISGIDLNKVAYSQEQIRTANPQRGDMEMLNGITWAELLPRITCPALLITADLDRGAIVRPEMAAAMQQQMPQLQVAHIPGAGHSIRREQFDRYIAVVRSFLDTWAATYWQAGTRRWGCN